MLCARRRALGSDAHYEPPVQMRFGPGDAFGVARALHNVECAVHGQAKEVKWVSHTVQALEDTTFAGIALTGIHPAIGSMEGLSRCFCRRWLRARTASGSIAAGWRVAARLLLACSVLSPSSEQNYEVLKAAHERSTDEKQRFLRSTQSLCRCSHECIAKLAALSRRVWIPAGTTIAGEGGESDAVYFCVHGQVCIAFCTMVPGVDSGSVHRLIRSSTAISAYIRRLFTLAGRVCRCR
jgi:CRP-like cAMP-binding protein